MISAGLNIDRILHFVFYDKILQIYRQHWIRKFYQKTYKFNTFNSTHQYIFPKYRQFPKNVGECYTGPPPPPPPTPPHTHPTHTPRSARPWFRFVWVYSGAKISKFTNSFLAIQLNMIGLFLIPNFKKLEELLIFKTDLCLKGKRYYKLQTYLTLLNSGWLICSLYQISRRLKNVYFVALIWA